MWKPYVLCQYDGEILINDGLFVVGHIAENCSSESRLCYNCRQPGHESSACPSPRTVSAKQCYSCGGVGHIQADCPSLRIQNAGGQKCYVSQFRKCSYDEWMLITKIELWAFWTHCAWLSKRRGRWGRNLRLSRTSPWTCTQYIYSASREMLSLRWSKPSGTVCL